MNQDERWLLRFNEVKAFIEENHRNPSRHFVENRNLLSWIKQQRKLINASRMKPERLEPFNKLMELWEENKRVNQYQ